MLLFKRRYSSHVLPFVAPRVACCASAEEAELEESISTAWDILIFLGVSDLTTHVCVCVCVCVCARAPGCVCVCVCHWEKKHAHSLKTVGVCVCVAVVVVVCWLQVQFLPRSKPVIFLKEQKTLIAGKPMSEQLRIITPLSGAYAPHSNAQTRHGRHAKSQTHTPASTHVQSAK